MEYLMEIQNVSFTLLRGRERGGFIKILDSSRSPFSVKKIRGEETILEIIKIQRSSRAGGARGTGDNDRIFQVKDQVARPLTGLILILPQEVSTGRKLVNCS